MSDRSCLPSIPLHYLDRVASTNTALWQLLDEGATPPLAVTARTQTAGRGQWGRQWHSPPGGLYLSIAIEPHLDPRYGCHLTLSAAWGVAIALRGYQIPVKLKWFNDLLLQGRKLGGLLAQTRIRGGKITTAVIGIGINWNNPVPAPGISLNTFSARLEIRSLQHLRTICIDGLLSGYNYYQSQGSEALLSAYDDLLDARGRIVEVDGMSAEILGIAPTGALRLRPSYPSQATEVWKSPGTMSLGYD